MLVLTRLKDESIIVGDVHKITVAEIEYGRAKIIVTGPRHFERWLRVGGGFYITPEIEVMIPMVKGKSSVRVSIKAPRNVPIWRQEMLEVNPELSKESHAKQ